MKKKIIGIFFCMLFVGVSISSAISIENKSTNVEDCGCIYVSNDKHICELLNVILNITYERMDHYALLIEKSDGGLQFIIYMSLLASFTGIFYVIKKTMDNMNCEIDHPAPDVHPNLIFKYKH